MVSKKFPDKTYSLKLSIHANFGEDALANFEKALFCLDAIENSSFYGYTNGDTWNGFTCPFFEKSVAEMILKASQTNGYVSTYDAERDVFIVRSKEDPSEYAPEEFAGQKIDVNAQELKLYPIGANSWVWGSCE